MISEICIRRPVFATVLSLVIMLIGIVSYTRLPVREYPKIDEPVVTVDTTYHGASAEIIESQITKPLEDSLAGIEGVDVLSPRSRAPRTARSRSASSWSATPTPRPPTCATASRACATSCRPDVDEPVIAKVEADANPIIWLAFSSDTHSPLEVTDVASRIVKPRLQTLPGAADVRVFGERKYCHAHLARPRAAGRLQADAGRTSRTRCGGRTSRCRPAASKAASANSRVVAQTDLTKPEQFAAIVVRQVNGYPVRIRDVGRVEIGAAVRAQHGALQGQERRWRWASSSRRPPIRSSCPRRCAPSCRGVIADLPQGMTVNIAYDSSVFIDRSINAVFETIGEAILLVAAIIFLFLRNWRATLIPLVTIPVSLIGAFALMFVMGFTINTLTLLALVLAIGLVVDDAIVVLENIYRHIEDGMPRLQAAFQGSQEIGFAVVAMTLTLAAVYAPVAFMTGRTGKLFIEFALTLAGAVLVSGFVALTLSPMMCSLLLRHETKHGTALPHASKASLNWLTQRLPPRPDRWSLRRRWLVLLVFVLVGGSSCVPARRA